MYAFLNKYGQALAFGIGVLITIIFLGAIFTAPQETFDQLQLENNPPEKYETNIFNFGIGISLVLTALAFVVALIFGVFQFASNPKGSIKGLIGLGALAIIVFVGYSMASGDISTEPADIQEAITKFETSQEADFTSGNLKFVSGAITASLVMIALSVVTLVVFGIRGLFK